jgi:DNA-binding winged helix-turn-helix (wHTH) protein/tetratricopeptide (TPR) repeat protein
LFGPFEVLVGLGILRRSGRRIKIQEQPFQLLLVLLEHSGELVSKKELRRRLWAQETFIEFDKSLYVTVAKLREALGDDAATPSFVKTANGRGYRFIGKVTPRTSTPAQPPDEFKLRELLPEVPPVSLALQPEIKELRAPHRVLRLSIWGVPAALIVTIVCLLVYGYDHRPLVLDQDGVVLGGFTNSTGDHELDKTLSSAFRLKIEESPYLKLIPNQSLRAIISDPDSASLKEELRACVSIDGNVLLSGRILLMAQGYEVQLLAWRCTDGRLLTTQKAQAASQAAILPAVDLASERMRRRLGEPEATLHAFSVPLLHATTTSLAALKAFTLGEEKRSQGLMAESVTRYKLAVDLDPQFALAYARLATAYSNASQISTGGRFYQKAFELRDRATDREKLYIVAHYYDYSTHEIRRAIEDYELWRAIYPRDLVPMNNLAIQYLTMGEPQKALDLTRIALQMYPSNTTVRGTLALADLKLGHYAAVNSICADPGRGDSNVLGFHLLCFRAAFAQNDEHGMQDQLQWALGSSEESQMLADAARVAMYRGKASEARNLFSEGKRNALRNNLTEAAIDIQLDEAMLEADFGFMSEAREDAQAALDSPSVTPVEEGSAALALARAGYIRSAEELAKKATSQAPLDTILNSAILASTRAAIQLQRHQSADAVGSLEETRPFDLCTGMQLAPAYYRGLAYLQGKQLQQAIVEFRRAIDHRDLPDFPVYSLLSQLEMGRAFQLSGDEASAAMAYGEVEKVWRDSDPSFPPLRKLHAYQRELSMRRIGSTKDILPATRAAAGAAGSNWSP